GQLPQLAFAVGARAPVGLAAVAGDDEVAFRGEGDVDRQPVELRKQNGTPDVAAPRLHELDAPELAAREAGNDRVAFPLRRAEAPVAGSLLVEGAAAGGLMLRPELRHRGLVVH